MGINAMTDALRQKIIADINQSGLPICMVDYVVTEIANQVKMDYLSAIQQENHLAESLAEMGEAEETEGSSKEFSILKGDGIA